MRILVVANETVAGHALIDAVKKHQGASVHVICPLSEPKHGYVIHEGDVRDATENRLAMTLAQLKEAGIEATGEVMDPDPYSAIMDALGRGGLRRDHHLHPPRDPLGLAAPGPRDARASRPAAGRSSTWWWTSTPTRQDATRTLVVANQTVGGEPLIEQLKELAKEGERRFIVISPQSGEDEDDAPQRLAHTLERLEQEGLKAIGQVTHPDPYTAIQNATDFYGIDEIVISTFPETRSGWLRADLVGRVQTSTGKPVHHVVSS